MTLFTRIKAAVTTKQAAEFYGQEVDRAGMTRCPFHPDTHPSMKVDERYYCFGCHKTGDVIDFTAGLFDLTPLEAARKLAQDFGIDPNTPASAVLSIPRVHPKIGQQKKEDRCESVLIDYEQILKARKERYAPTDPDAEWDERFVAATMNLPRVSHFIDSLHSADERERREVTDYLTKDGTIDKINTWNKAHWKKVMTDDHEELSDSCAA